jgi:hypothetical protein
VDALKIKVNSLKELQEAGKAIRDAGRPYKYVTIDTVTALEEMVMPLAVKLYRATPKPNGPISSNINSKSL